MKLAVMQPYLFPYLGYFQLIQSTDQFVILDDVQFIKGGWINRNRILIGGRDHLFTFSLKKTSFSLLINEREFSVGYIREKKKFMDTLKLHYAKAPYFEPTYAVVEQILDCEERNVAKFIANSVKVLCQNMGLKTKFLLSSEIDKDPSLKASDRILDICSRLKADHYINAIKGTALYNKEDFVKEGIALNFIKINALTYPQFNNTFVPNLSIIDVLMFNSKEAIKNLLKQYELI